MMGHFGSKRKKYYVIIHKNDKLVYEGSWTFSRKNTSENRFMSPEEIKASDWKDMFDGNHTIELTKELRNMDELLIKSLIDIDLYNLTMGQFAYFNSFEKKQIGVYAVNVRDDIDLSYLKDDLKKQIKLLKNLKFTEDEISYLKECPDLKDIFKDEYLDFLRSWSLKSIQFEITADTQLRVRATGSWEDAIMADIFVLSLINELHFRNKGDFKDGRSVLKDKIKKLKGSSVKFVDMGSRRRYSRDWHEEVVSTLVKELPNNFVGTSNVFLAKEFNIKPIGTMAHEFFQAYQVLGTCLETSQKEALYAWYNFYGDKLNTALTDILGTDVFLHDCDKDLTQKYKGYRQDSSCPFEWGDKMLAHFHEHGVDAKDKNLIFSDSLNFDKAIKINESFGEKSNVLFGIGTFLTNDFSSHKALKIVMKLVSMNGSPVIKISDDVGKINCEDDNLIKTTLEYIEKIRKFPRIDLTVDAIVENDKGELLVIQRGDESEAGYKQYALVGGYVDYFEKSKDSIIREIKEEVGLNVESVSFHEVRDEPFRDPRKRTVSIVYKVKTSGTIKTNKEVMSYKWISKANLDFAFDHEEIIKDVL